VEVEDMTQTRPVTLSRNGMVSSPHYLASVAGMGALQAGGTAVDAGIAMNAALGVVYPHMSGPGGDAFWLIYDARSSELHALNGSGRAGAQVTRQLFRSLGHDTIPSRGPLAAITVPGAVDSWCTAHDRFGRRPLRELLEPAITHAREGFPVGGSQARYGLATADVLATHDRTRDVFLPGGTVPVLGDLLRLPHLAETMEAVAERGRDGFYAGPVAEEMARSLQAAGGLLTTADFAAHHAEWTEPISTTYRGLTCWQPPPNSQGFAHLMVLNILEGFDLASIGENTAGYVHLVVEATKLAFAERDRYLTDPEFADIPLERLLSKEFAADLRAQIQPDRAQPVAPEYAAAGDTTCSVAVDRDGNAVSIIQSLYHEYGSGFVAGDSGVLLQNRGASFSLDDSHVNRLEPGKRTFHTLMPGMLFADRTPVMVYGTMGGEGQPQTSTAMVTRVVDFHDDIQTALDRPRWLHGRTWGADTADLRIESRFATAAIAGLRERGHPVRVVDDWDDCMGHAQGIQVDGRGIFLGGADARGEGLALGW